MSRAVDCLQPTRFTRYVVDGRELLEAPAVQVLGWDTRPESTHGRAVFSFIRYLKSRGYTVAREVGVPGGRVDIVRLDRNDVWVELYDVKLRGPYRKGADQLRRYSEAMGGGHLLTLVVPNEVEFWRAMQQRGGVDVGVVAVDFDELRRLPQGTGSPGVDLPYHWKDES